MLVVPVGALDITRHIWYIIYKDDQWLNPQCKSDTTIRVKCEISQQLYNAVSWNSPLENEIIYHIADMIPENNPAIVKALPHMPHGIYELPSNL